MRFVNYKFMKFFGIIIASLLSVGLFAQQPQTEEEELKQMRESIDRQIEQYTDLMDLDDSQIFYVDSILTHNYGAMRTELKDLQMSKVSNSDLYQRVSDKWMEQTYQATKKVLNDEQWAKYLKSGAARDKKNRDKREAKRQ